MGNNGRSKEWCDDVWVYNFRFFYNGRQGFGITGARNISIHDGTIARIRRSMFDLEPNTATGGISNLLVARVICGSHRLNWVSMGGSGTVDRVTFQDCDSRGSDMTTKVKVSSLAPRSNLTFSRNTSNKAAGNPSGAVMDFANASNVVVTDNHQPLQTGRTPPMVFAQCRGRCAGFINERNTS